MQLSEKLIIKKRSQLIADKAEIIKTYNNLRRHIDFSIALLQLQFFATKITSKMSIQNYK